MTNSALLLQSEVSDPFARYRALRARGPLFWDAEQRIWTILSYDACAAVLHDSRAGVPALSTEVTAGMSPASRAIAKDLVRLAGPPAHCPRRRTAEVLFEAFGPPEPEALLDGLLGPCRGGRALDWVSRVCTKLPVLWILSALGFDPADRAVLLDGAPILTTILRPSASPGAIAGLNAIVPTVGRTVERHIRTRLGVSAMLPRSEGLALAVANLIGLLIQSYDAGRGLLANALLHACRLRTSGHHRLDFRSLVQETLRFDPPIHNTRRVTREDMVLAGTKIPAGQSILVVLAAANRDPDRFAQPEQFDPGRSDAETHLSFGAGLHLCPAHRWAVEMCAATLTHLFRRYPRLQLSSVSSEVEPIVNARLIKKINVIL